MEDADKLDVSIEKTTEKDTAPQKPYSFGNYLKLPLTEEERDLHTSHILKRINEVLEDPERKDVMEAAESYRNQYYGIVGKKFPEWGFNLDMRLTPKIQDAVVAQTQEAFDDVDPHWAVGPAPNKDLLPIRDKQERILDYFEDVDMNNVEDLEGIRHDAYLLGLGWEALVFDRKFERVRELVIYKTLQEFVLAYPDDFIKYPQYITDLQLGKPISIIEESNKEVRRSPRRKHIEFEDGIVPLTAKGVEGVNNADIAARRVWMKYHEIKTLEEDGDYIKGVSDRLRYKSVLGKDNELVEDPDYLNKSYETYEVIYNIYITIDGKKRRAKCLFNVAKEHQLCLRAIRYPYNHNRTYLIPHSIKFTNKGLYQDGIGRMLQDIHIAGNATINHILDASVIANSLSLKAREGSDGARRVMEHRWYPGSVLELQNTDDVQQFNFATPNLSALISLFGIIEKFGQDVSGIVNYQLGVESPEDPTAPASKTIALMRKAEIKLRRYIKNLKRSEDEAGYQALRLIYQFTPAERLAEILGEPVDNEKALLQPHLKVVTNASGFAIEKIFAKRDDMTMAGMLVKTPFLQDPIRLSRMIYTLAKDYGSNWDKKIIGIIPSPEEIQAEQEKAKQEHQAKKMQVIQEAAQKVLQSGGSPEEARSVALQSGEMYETMSQKQAQQPQGANNVQQPVQA